MAPPTVLVATVAMFMVMEYARPRTRWCARELFIGRDASPRAEHPYRFDAPA